MYTGLVNTALVCLIFSMARSVRFDSQSFFVEPARGYKSFFCFECVSHLGFVFNPNVLASYCLSFLHLRVLSHKCKRSHKTISTLRGQTGEDSCLRF